MREQSTSLTVNFSVAPFARRWRDGVRAVALVLGAGLLTPGTPPALAQTTVHTTTPPVVAAVPTPLPPAPVAQAYVAVDPPARLWRSNVMVPVTFLMNGLGASAGPVEGFWRIVYYQHVIEVYPNQLGARFDGRQVQLPAKPQQVDNTLYLPWQPLAELLGVKWRIVDPADDEAASLSDPAYLATEPALRPELKDRVLRSAHDKNKTILLIQYPAAYIEGVHTVLEPDRLRLVLQLSNATRITAAQRGLDVMFHLAGARRPGVPTVRTVNDYLVPRVVTRSGNWQADFTVRINYSAPVHWFTLGYPPRLVIDAQRLFEESDSQGLGGGLSLTKVRKGTQQGPVQMFVVRVDPAEGWRVRVAPGGYSVLQRTRPSLVARKHRALVAVNGGFFAYNGAAVGALLVNGEWLRLPWKGRTAIGFRPDGSARIDNLQAQARAVFEKHGTLPIRALNAWPTMGRISALTRHFGTYYKLRPGEMAVVVNKDAVVAKPGSGHAPICARGFTLIASGGALPYLNTVARGEKATLDITAPGWQGYTSAVGGGPRLVKDGHIEVTDVREAFRADVRVGRGPRTAFGVDKAGRYIIVVIDGRQNYYSVGLTLTELAYTMQKLGAVDAINLDGGGSTAMAVRDRVVNHPSDGVERSVANALLVMR